LRRRNLDLGSRTVRKVETVYGPDRLVKGKPKFTSMMRHTGNTLSAEAGASLAELMSRMGHSSARAAMVYLHARDERNQQLAASMDRMARRELRRSAVAQSVSRSGTQRAREAGKRRPPGMGDHGEDGTGPAHSAS
jgi:hypothetical protein